MIKRGNKKGSHVGVVISFVIFVTFIIFLYSLTKTSIQPEEKENSLLEYLKTELIEDASAELNTFTVSLEKSTGPSCIELNGISSKLGINSRMIVKNQNQETTNASLNGDDLRIDRIDNKDDFFKIYTSNEFPGTIAISGSCLELNEGEDYTLGLTKTEKYVFEKKVFDLMTAYSNYENMKEYLKIPEGSEFGLGFVYENGTSVNVGIKDVSTDIYIREIPVQYISREGDINTGFMEIMIW
jgi:hypothetical protein